MNLYDYGVPVTKEELLDGIIDKGMSELCSKLWESGYETLFSCSGLISEHGNYRNWGGTYVVIKINNIKDVLLFLKMKFFFGRKIVLLQKKSSFCFGYYPINIYKYIDKNIPTFQLLENKDLDTDIRKAISKFIKRI